MIPQMKRKRQEDRIQKGAIDSTENKIGENKFPGNTIIRWRKEKKGKG